MKLSNLKPPYLYFFHMAYILDWKSMFDKFLYIFAESEVKMSEDEDTAAANPREQLLKAHR